MKWVCVMCQLCNVFCMYRHCMCGWKCVCVCVLNEWYKAWSMSMTQSRRCHPPCLPSAKTRDTTFVNMSAFVTTTLSQSNNHKMLIQTPTWQTKHVWTAAKACQIWRQSLWQNKVLHTVETSRTKWARLGMTDTKAHRTSNNWYGRD